MKQMLVHGEQNLMETAVLQDGRLVEYDMERAEGRQGVGNVYKGKIVNVLPGMQAAFVDIGQGKNAFLYIDDVLHPHLDRQPKEKPEITELLRPGQDLVVQVIKEQINGKGARVTTHYSLPGRWLVYMPTADYVGVSKKIASEGERNRLRVAGEELRQPGEGVILRTAAEGESEDALGNDLMILRELWENIARRAEQSAAPCELHREAGLVRRLVRDILDFETDEVWIDSREAYGEAVSWIREMAPSMVSRVQWYGDKGKVSLFERYEVPAQLDKAFGHRIRLASGGDLAWDQTEALTVVDVNTGKFIGTSSLEDTVFRTNMEAAAEIARLLQLRDVGGIIIIDFIDMEKEEHRDQVLQRLEQYTRTDRTKCHVIGWTKLGLLEMTRKKIRENAVDRFYEACGVCRGSGKIYTGVPGRQR
jgi:ribonuclease G